MYVYACICARVGVVHARISWRDSTQLHGVQRRALNSSSFFLFLNDRIVSTTQIFQIGSIIAWAVLQLQFICIQSFTINRNFNWKITPRIRVSFRITFHSPLFKLSLIKNALRRITLNKYPCVWIISWVKLIGFSFQFRPIINANYYIISFA